MNNTDCGIDPIRGLNGKRAEGEKGEEEGNEFIKEMLQFSQGNEMEKQKRVRNKTLNLGQKDDKPRHKQKRK